MKIHNKSRKVQMGDSRRFRLFADLIHHHFSPDMKIADIASGKGKLQGALHQLGYEKVISWDKRQRNASGRENYHYGYLDWETSPGGYDAIVAMHPDQATDHCIFYAAKHRIPAIVCPCCVRPSATYYSGPNYSGPRAKYFSWIHHLVKIAKTNGMSVVEISLKMDGANRVLICKPK